MQSDGGTLATITAKAAGSFNLQGNGTLTRLYVGGGAAGVGPAAQVRQFGGLVAGEFDGGVALFFGVLAQAALRLGLGLQASDALFDARAGALRVLPVGVAPGRRIAGAIGFGVVEIAVIDLDDLDVVGVLIVEIDADTIRVGVGLDVDFRAGGAEAFACVVLGHYLRPCITYSVLTSYPMISSLIPAISGYGHTSFKKASILSRSVFRSMS